MSDGKKPEIDPNKVKTLPNGEKIRPGRFVSSGEGMSVEEPGQQPADAEDDEQDV